MLLKDGRLGLIDYGQVKTMSLPLRISYAKLIIAHARMDKQEVVRLHFDELGTKTKYSDKEIGYLMSAFYNDRYSLSLHFHRLSPLLYAIFRFMCFEY